MVGKITTEIELKVPIAKLWKAFHDPALISKAIPESFKGVEVIEGDGGSAGSIRKLIFTADSPHGAFLKEKVISVDKDSYTIVTEQIEGAMIGKLFSFTKVTFKLSPVGADTTKLLWEFEYEALIADPPVEKAKEGAIRTLKSIETYLISSKEYE